MRQSLREALVSLSGVCLPLSGGSNFFTCSAMLMVMDMPLVDVCGHGVLPLNQWC